MVVVQNGADWYEATRVRLKYSAGLGWAIESKFDKKEGYSGRDDFFKDRAEGDCCRDPL